MDENALNRLLEETFQNIVQNDGPNILQRISQSVRDISNISIPIVQQQTEHIIDVSMNSIEIPNDTTISNRSNIRTMLDDFSYRWFSQMNNYHNCIRDYHKNILQMNTISSNLLRNIAIEQSTITPNLHLPHSRMTPMFQATPSSIEIQGFSIPIPSMSSINSSSNVFPTISQIMNAVDIFTYSEENRVRVTENRCPISLEDFVSGEELCEIKHCHHVFKWSSLQGWFSRNTCCPVCRYDIRQEDNNS